jgi:hypothetical protein
MGEMSSVHRILTGRPEGGKKHSENVGVNGTIIIGLILGK